MQLKFKQQRYQADAARAVVELFSGQPKQGRFAYLRDLGRAPAADPSCGLGHLALDDAPAEGFGNAPVAPSAEQLL